MIKSNPALLILCKCTEQMRCNIKFVPNMTGYVYLHAVMLCTTMMIQKHCRIICTFTWQNTYANVIDCFHTHFLFSYSLCHTLEITIILKICIRWIIIYNKVGPQIPSYSLKLYKYNIMISHETNSTGKCSVFQKPPNAYIALHA